MEAGLTPGPEVLTPRLLLRPPVRADLPALFAVLGDPAAMRHTHRDGTPRDCRRRVLLHERRRRRDGYAPWTVVQRADGRVIGWGGLYQDPFEPGWGVEVGYFLHPGSWGQGLASELVAACLALADGALALPEVRAFAHRDNLASRRVLARAGFEEVRFVPELDRLLFRRPRPAGAAQPPSIRRG